jgi:hypothetical protein
MSDIDLDYEIGDIVYFALGGEDSKGIVSGLIIKAGGLLEYEVVWSDRSRGWHTPTELQTEKPQEDD